MYTPDYHVLLRTRATTIVTLLHATPSVGWLRQIFNDLLPVSQNIYKTIVEDDPSA